MEDALNKVPNAPTSRDELAVLQRDECKKCTINKGIHVLKPCGHGLFCTACVRKLRQRGTKMKFFAPNCLHPDCPFAVTEWITLVNVNNALKSTS